MLRYATGLLLLMLLVCGVSCRDSEPESSVSFRVFRGGYSAPLDTILFRFSPDARDPLKGSFLATYNQSTGVVQSLIHPVIQSQIHPLNPGPVDVAWVPGRPAFAVTHGECISFFERDRDGSAYGARALPCPLGPAYGACSWSPDGRWLAVACVDLNDPSWTRKLGVYDLQREKFVLTDVVAEFQRPFWKNDATLLVMRGDEAVEVTVGSEPPKITATIPVGKGADWFYGMYDGQALVLRGKVVCLGVQRLIELEEMRISRVMPTDTTLFAAASATNLAAFDHQGREIARIDPGREIEFGSIGEDPSTVYALAGNSLVEVSVEDGQLQVRDLCDLGEEMRESPQRRNVAM